MLYLAADNKLYYPNNEVTIGAFRAYFKLADGITAGDKTGSVRAFVLNFGEGETSGIVDAEANTTLYTQNSTLPALYTLDGRRLSGQPAAIGIYISNGHKVYVK